MAASATPCGKSQFWKAREVSHRRRRRRAVGGPPANWRGVIRVRLESPRRSPPPLAALSALLTWHSAGFVKGLAPAASASIPVQVVYYGAYEYTRFVLGRALLGGARAGEHAHNELTEFGIDACAGAVGEIVSGAIWVPADLVSQRLMLQGPDRSKHLYSGMRDATRKIWRAEGLRGFYVGFGASLFTCIPNSAAQWAIYEYTKKQLYRHWWWPRQGLAGGGGAELRGEGSYFINVLSAVTAGVVGSAISTPFDVIRVRKQAEGLSSSLVSAAAPVGGDAAVREQFHSARLYRGSTFLAMRRLVAEVGWTGLFRGIVPRCLGAAPQSALALVAYDLVKNLSKKRDDQF